jgi:hypothetical protein
VWIAVEPQQHSSLHVEQHRRDGGATIYGEERKRLDCAIHFDSFRSPASQAATTTSIDHRCTRRKQHRRERGGELIRSTMKKETFRLSERAAEHGRQLNASVTCFRFPTRASSLVHRGLGFGFGFRATRCATATKRSQNRTKQAENATNANNRRQTRRRHHTNNHDDDNTTNPILGVRQY